MLGRGNRMMNMGKKRVRVAIEGARGGHCRGDGSKVRQFITRSLCRSVFPPIDTLLNRRTKGERGKVGRVVRKGGREEGRGESL